MKSIQEQYKIGVRWLNCGWRLFRRRPWVLLGMGLLVTIAINLLTLIPVVGNILLAILLPLLASSTLLTIHDTAMQQSKPVGRKSSPALMRPLTELGRVFMKQELLLTMLVVCLYTLTASILIIILGYLISGGSWIASFSTLDMVEFIRVAGAWIAAIILFIFVIASLFFSVPLVAVRKAPLVPAMKKSLKASKRYLFGLLVLLGLIAFVELLGIIAGIFSPLGGAAVWTVAGSLVLPVFMTSSYCSYRTLFTKK